MGETRDLMRTKAAIAKTTATATEAGALPTIGLIDPVQLREVEQVDHYGAGDGFQTQGGRSVVVRATESQRRNWDQPFRIRNKRMNESLDSDMERERPSGL